MIETHNARCSFCGKSEEDVQQLIAGNEAFICAECVSSCAKVLQDAAETTTHQSGSDSSATQNALADEVKLLTPEEIHKFLDDYVVGQEYSKKALSVAVYNHYKKIIRKDSKIESDVELGKSNVLLIGPTGCGKTLLAETLARMLNVPFAIADATTLTEAGYVGEDVENIIQKLLQNCDYNVAKAEVGIVYIDEIDKIARKAGSPSLMRDVSGEGVQQALLKLIEGTSANVPPPNSRKYAQQEYIHINTKNILFICGGAFDSLEKIVQERTEQSGMGFNARIKAREDNTKAIGELLRQTEPEDLIKFGLIPEFVGRLPIIAVLDELEESDLLKILKEPKNSLIKQYRKLFGMDGVEIEFNDKALKAIAHKAKQRKSGARGLRSILEHALLDTMYRIPTLKNLDKILVTDYVGENELKLKMLYNNANANVVAKSKSAAH